MDILAVFNAKGGVGKTTTAVNLAACFAAMGYRVVVLDLDAQGNATSSLGLGHAPTIGTYDVIVGGQPVTNAMTLTFMEGVSVIGATESMITVDIDLVAGEVRSGVISRVSDPIRDETDILIMDCSPTFGTMTINALVSADWVVIPTQPSSYAHDGLRRTWTVLGKIRDNLQPNLRVLGILPTFCNRDDGNTGPEGEHDEVIKAMRAEFGNLVHRTGIPLDDELFRSATAVGLPSCILAPGARASRAYVDVALHMVGSRPKGEMAPIVSRRGHDKPTIFQRFDDPSEDQPGLHAVVVKELERWRRVADSAGVIARRINVPTVDEAAIAALNAPSIVDDEAENEAIWSGFSHVALTLGVGALLAVAGFAAGWAARAGIFQDLLKGLS